jgi:hypothetical protein
MMLHVRLAVNSAARQVVLVRVSPLSHRYWSWDQVSLRGKWLAMFFINYVLS